MAIESILGGSTIYGGNSIAQNSRTGSGEGSSFADMLQDAIGQTVSTDQQDKVSSLQLLTGDGGELHNVMIDAEQAELSLRMMLQIRNKCMDAYSEIMRMQV